MFGLAGQLPDANNESQKGGKAWVSADPLIFYRTILHFFLLFVTFLKTSRKRTGSQLIKGVKQ